MDKLESDARGKGFLRIARKADAALHRQEKAATEWTTSAVSDIASCKWLDWILSSRRFLRRTLWG
jgi:hypothetical protein